MRLVKPFVTTNTLRMTYYSYIHSVMSYGFLFWRNYPDSIKIFRLQKKIIRIMTGCRSTDSCGKLFISLEILPLPSQYIFPFFCHKKQESITDQFWDASHWHQTTC